MGSNQVDLGGIVAPAAATPIICPIVVGCIAKATAALPDATSRSSSAVPRMPPTN